MRGQGQLEEEKERKKMDIPFSEEMVGTESSKCGGTTVNWTLPSLAHGSW